MIQKMILIIEDDADLRETMSFALQSEGYQTLIATNGREGLDLLVNRSKDAPPIACILLDWMMPEMNGREFLQILHERHPDMARIPVLIATATASAAGAESPYSVQRIQKPMELDELYTAVRKSCSVRRINA